MVYEQHNGNDHRAAAKAIALKSRAACGSVFIALAITRVSAKELSKGQSLEAVAWFSFYFQSTICLSISPPSLEKYGDSLNAFLHAIRYPELSKIVEYSGFLNSTNPISKI